MVVKFSVDKNMSLRGLTGTFLLYALGGRW
jgi:hypothetical protein